MNYQIDADNNGAVSLTDQFWEYEEQVLSVVLQERIAISLPHLSVPSYL